MLPAKLRSLAASSSCASSVSWFPFSGLLADREQPDLGIADAEDLLREDRTHVRELEEVLRPGVRVRSRIEQDGRAVACRDRHGDRGTPHSGQPANLEQARGQHRAGVARGHDGLGLAFADRTAGADERALRLAADRVGRLLVHRDHVGRLDQLEALRVEARRTDDDRDDVVRACVERARDDLLGP